MIIDEIEEIRDNSYKNFHSKGLDYICLKRTPENTIKYYFFDNPKDQVVAPHNHRYDFTTRVLAGGLTDVRYLAMKAKGEKYNRFSWYTPLLKGKGFQWHGEVRLMERTTHKLTPGMTLTTKHWHLHTLKDVQPGTVLKLIQGKDIKDLGDPTYTYFPIEHSNDLRLDGLYEKFTTDEIIKRLESIFILDKAAIE